MNVSEMENLIQQLLIKFVNNSVVVLFSGFSRSKAFPEEMFVRFPDVSG